MTENKFVSLRQEGAIDEMARPERFELPTLGSEDRCSIQLSYGRCAAFLA